MANQDNENTLGSWWGDMANAFKESVKSLIGAGTERLNKEIIGQSDVTDYPKRQLENDYYDDEHADSYDGYQRQRRRSNGEYQGFVFNNIPLIYVGGGLLLLVLLMRK